jgi:hypothetical protein
LIGITGLFFVVFALKNRIAYGQFLVTAQPYQVGNFLKGLPGVLFDLRHGLLPFAPILIVAVAGWKRAVPVSRKQCDPDFYAFLIFVSYYLVTAFWIVWRGGSCYGPRLMLPAIPAFALPIARAWEHWGAKTRFRFWVYCLMIGGFTVQWCAATHPFEAFWSVSIPELLIQNYSYAITGIFLGVGILVILARTVPLIQQAVPVMQGHGEFGHE